MAEHGKAGKRGHHGGDAKIFVAGAELVDGGAFVGIAHEVDVTLHDVGIEFEGVLKDGAVFGVVFVAQHDHEGAVVDAMHAEGADEVAFHEPEGFGEEQGAGDFGGDAIDDFAPELMRHERIEFGLGHAVFGARGNGAAGAGHGKPEALDVAAGEGHGGVEANDGEEARDVQDGLDDLFADGGAEVVQLCGVVPGEAGAVVAVIDVVDVAGAVVAAAEDDGGVGLFVVVVFDFDFDAVVVGEIGAFEL